MGQGDRNRITNSTSRNLCHSIMDEVLFSTFKITGNPVWADELEVSLYNALLHST